MTEKLLREARAEMLVKAGAGTHCPCCGRIVKAYMRKLHATMARYLIEIVVKQLEQSLDVGLFDFSGYDWVDVTELSAYKSGSQRGDYGYLKHWGLIEPKENEDKKKRTSGMWRATSSGKDFVHGRLRVPSHVVLLLGDPIAWSDDNIYIKDALGDTFDYSELMGPLASR